MKKTCRVIGHRGVCGMRPEHTFAAYQLAIEQGADAIELDLVPTRDGHLICRHDGELSVTTDVADHSEFHARRRAIQREGKQVAGWFVEDFTLPEIRSLRARERFAFRDHRCDGQFNIPTLAEVLDWLRESRNGRSRPTVAQPGLILELKDPSYYASIGLPLGPLLEETLDRAALPNDVEVCIESFEPAVLQQLARRRNDFQFCQLIGDAEMPEPFAKMLSRPGLEQIRKYAGTVGVWKRLIIPSRLEKAGQSSIERLNPPTTLVPDAHAVGLRVEAWTFRDEPRFLALEYAGDPINEYRRFIDLGVDGLISDFPATAIRARSGAGCGS